MKKVLITGAAGCLGQGIQEAFKGKYEMRLMDVAPFESELGEVFIGDVTNADDVERAMEGMDGLVIAHMLSRTNEPGAYKIPSKPFDVNVKGTVFLFQEAWQRKIKNVVLISSTGVTFPYGRTRRFITRDLEPQSEKNFYGLTKVCQEKVAEFYHLTHGINVATLRIGCVVVADDDGDRIVRDKYGKVFPYRASALAERRDIGEVARRCMDLEDLTYEVMYVFSTEESALEYDMDYTYDRLNWKPKYDFKWLPYDPQWVEQNKQMEKGLEERRKNFVNSRMATSRLLR